MWNHFLERRCSSLFHRKKTFHLHNPGVKSNDTAAIKRSVSPYKGLLLAMVGAVFTSITAVIVKKLTNIHPGQLSIYRFVAVLVFSLPEAVKSQEDLLGPVNARFLLIIRGILGATYTFLSFLAFRYLPIGECSVIIFSLPIFFTLAARMILKEPCGVFQTVTVLTTIAGIVLITKLPLKLSGHSVVYTNKSILGFLASFGTLFFGTCQYIAIRKLTDVHYSIIMLHFGWVSIIETAILTAFVGDFSMHDCGLEGLWIVLLGAASFIGQRAMTIALMCENAGPVATVRAAVDISFAFMWQVVLFKDPPDLYSSIGAGLVGLSVILEGVKKWTSELSLESTYRRRLAWMLK